MLIVTPRLLKCAASFLAALLGVMLLLADSSDDCERYEAFKASLDFTSDCPLASSQGRLSLDFAAQGGNGRNVDEGLAEAQLRSAGFSISKVSLEFTNACSDESPGRLTAIGFWLGESDAARYACRSILLPVTQPWTVTCYRLVDASTDSQQGDAGVPEGPSCSITFQPAAK